MKVLSTLMIILFAFNTYAVSVVGWERPVSESIMVAEISLGHYAEIKTARVVATKQDGSEEWTGVQVFVGDDYDLSFQVIGVEETDCGSKNLLTQYVPRAGELANTTMGYHTQMMFVDHSYNICHDVFPSTWEMNTWEVDIVDYSVVASVPAGELVLTGKPTPVYTIQIHNSAFK